MIGRAVRPRADARPAGRADPARDRARAGRGLGRRGRRPGDREGDAAGAGAARGRTPPPGHRRARRGDVRDAGRAGAAAATAARRRHAVGRAARGGGRGRARRRLGPPRLLPTAADLDDPLAFAQRTKEADDIDIESTEFDAALAALLDEGADPRRGGRATASPTTRRPGDCGRRLARADSGPDGCVSLYATPSRSSSAGTAPTPSSKRCCDGVPRSPRRASRRADPRLPSRPPDRQRARRQPDRDAGAAQPARQVPDLGAVRRPLRADDARLAAAALRETVEESGIDGLSLCRPSRSSSTPTRCGAGRSGRRTTSTSAIVAVAPPEAAPRPARSRWTCAGSHATRLPPTDVERLSPGPDRRAPWPDDGRSATEMPARRDLAGNRRKGPQGLVRTFAFPLRTPPVPWGPHRCETLVAPLDAGQRERRPRLWTSVWTSRGGLSNGLWTGRG